MEPSRTPGSPRPHDGHRAGVQTNQEVGDPVLWSRPSAADTETLLTFLVKGAAAVLSSAEEEEGIVGVGEVAMPP